MDTVLLKCDLGRAGDSANQLLLFSSKLIVNFKGQKSEFDYGQIVSIGIGHKKLIIALVLGGIGTTFSMLALSMGWYHYQLNLFLVFLFFGLMYYGFIGKEAIVIGEKGHQSVFLINANKAITGEFVNFIKERLWKLKMPIEEKIYHLIDAKSWHVQLASYHYQHESLRDEKFIHCSTKEQLLDTYEQYFSNSDQMILLSINPRWVIEEIKWEHSTERKSDFPHIYGPLNKSAIVWAKVVVKSENSLNILDQMN